MAARLQRIEAAFVDLPAKLQVIRKKYAVAVDSFRLLQAMITLTPESPARNRLLMAAELVLLNIYELANVLSTLVQLELAASDYAVMMCLLRDDLDSYEGQKAINVYQLPDGAKEQVA